MKIFTQLTKKDYINIKRHAILNLNRLKFQILFLIALSMMAFLIGTMSLMFIFITIVAWLAIIIGLITSLAVIPNEANYKENADFYLPTEYEFNEEGFSVTNPTSRTEYKWPGGVKWRIVKDYYILATANSGYIIKAQDIRDKDAFVKLLNEKVSNKIL